MKFYLKLGSCLLENWSRIEGIQNRFCVLGVFLPADYLWFLFSQRKSNNFLKRKRRERVIKANLFQYSILLKFTHISNF